MNTMYKTVVSIFFLFVFSSSLYAEEGYKLGAINAIRVLEQSPQADLARKMIEKEFSSRDKKLVAQQKKVKTLEDKLNKDGAIMSEQERTKLEKDIISKKRDIKRSSDEFREDLNFRRNEEFARIQKKIVAAIQRVAKDNKYDIVLSEGVIYANSKVDISDLVIDYLKQENGKTQ